MFKYILVSKKWLRTIASPSFRRKYKDRWKSIYDKITGFLILDYRCINADRPKLPRTVQLWPTSKLGRCIKESNFMANLGYFLAASSTGLILSECRRQKKYYVCNPVTKQVLSLPELPVRYRQVSIAILPSDDPEILNNSSKSMMDFKVVFGESNVGRLSETVSIQTFSSRTGEWNQSTATCSTKFSLIGIDAVVVAKGSAYWTARISTDPGCIAGYDPNKGRITLIHRPNNSEFPGNDFNHAYGQSPEGRIHYYGCSKTGIDVWVLDDDGSSDSSNNGWNFIYRIDFNSMEMKVSEIWTQVAPGTTFEFISSHPLKSDSIYLRCKGNFFLYSVETKKLVRPKNSRDNARYRHMTGLDVSFKPFTATEIWPYCPFSGDADNS